MNNGEAAVHGLILCGGRGDRMGGRDKGLLYSGTRRNVCAAAAVLEPLCNNIFVSANRNVDNYRALDIGPVIEDLRQNFAGPLAGFEAAARSVDGTFMLALPCDMPFLDAQVPQRLYRSLLADDELELVYASAHGDAHYLVAALRVTAMTTLGAYLDDGGRSVRHWYATRASAAVDCSDFDAEQFRNLNHPEDL